MILAASSHENLFAAKTTAVTPSMVKLGPYSTQGHGTKEEEEEYLIK